MKRYETIKNSLLSGMAVTLCCAYGHTETLTSFTEEEIPGGVRLTYAKIGHGTVTIDALLTESAVIFSVDARMPVMNGFPVPFAPENALVMHLGTMQPDALLASRHDGPWWMYPEHPKDFAAIPPRTQSLLVRDGMLHYHMLPLCGDDFRCEFEKGELRLTSGTSGRYTLHGAFLAVSVSADPFEAVHNNYVSARETGAVRVPLRTERTFPEIFGGFGFCTWDAFYREVSSENIYKKLTEFREKNIPVRWMIIDDGWLTANGGKLAGFEENREKFPEGFKETIRRIKEDFGVKYVGVWHAFNGYWDGVDPKSPLYEAQKDNLTFTPAGLCLTALDEEKAFRFWDAWHGYLASCGVDFLKVDNQSSNSGYMTGMLPTAEGCRIYHNAIERSIGKHFGGVVIDCMGMDMENALARPSSAVSRNSDDFFPRRERSFIKHLTQNVYNAVWHGQIHFCDFDMWWSDHESAVQSGVLRAISGSPIYVSDEYGRSRAETIAPVIESDGTVMRCENPAQPTLDCLYTDCTAERKLLKIWNKSGSCFGVAAFNVSDGDVTDTVDFSAVPAWKDDGDYMAYEYFSRTWTRVNRCEDITLTLPRDGVAVWAVYPVEHPDPDSDEGAYVLAGDCGKYLPIASKYRIKRMLSELL